tara:strand:- start:3726 stop:3977 length:252 start_codon:yes stop_codon:yes gene_type:complete
MAFTADNRPHTIGDLLVITGTVANGDTSADLSAFLTEILWGDVTNVGALGGAPSHNIGINGTTINFNNPGVAAGGKLFVIGKR